MREKWLQPLREWPIRRKGWGAQPTRIGPIDERLGRAPGRIEAEVALRTAELTRTNTVLAGTLAELKAAKEAAEAASRSKSQFLANMSHEIRTPMNGVLGFLELLRNDRLSERQRTYTNMALTSGESLLQLINDILDFSKIEAGKLEITMARLDIQRLVEEVVEFFGEQAREKKIELACHIAATVPPVIQGDSLRLRQVLVNLVGNAVKFTEKGEVVVRVSFMEETTESVTLRFEVQDTGTGITPEALSRIFHAFSQGDGATTRRYGGTGLGLTIARQLVQLMGGKIEVASTPGEGSTFRFTARFEKQPPDAQGAASYPLQGLRVLVAVGTVTNRTILRRQLEGWGIRNDSVEDGARAIDMLLDAAAAGDDYRVVILDTAGPGMAGSELVRAIRTEPHLTALKLIMLTSASDPEGESGNSGIWAYLHKPIMQSQLYNLLASLSDRPTPGLPEKASPAELQTDKTDKGCFSSLRILLVEDNPVNQALGRVMLEYFGCRTDVAKNGIEAIRAFDGSRYDLILMDCQMPEMDGYETTRAIRQKEEGRPRSARTPIVALTAHAMEGDREVCIAAGMDDYLSKPFKRDGLYAVLDRWVVSKAGCAEQRQGTLDAVPSARPDPHQEGEQGQADPQHNEQPLIDMNFLDVIASLDTTGSDHILEKVVRLFFNNSPALLSEIHAAAAREDHDALGRAAHTLKSTSANLGARSLAELCRTLEAQCRMDVPGDTAALVAQIEGEYARVLCALEEELTRRI
jgi:two-component system, sensor histidine kinase and response regulator